MPRMYSFKIIKGTFRPDRIKSIAERFGVDGNMALENILYGISDPHLNVRPLTSPARAWNSEHQVRVSLDSGVFDTNTCCSDGVD
jgi:hypothetical protein